MSTATPRIRPRVMIGSAVVVVILVLAGVAWSMRGGTEKKAAATPRATPTAASTIAGPKAPAVPPSLMMGNAKAPVLIEEFSDYQCAACAKFANQTEPALIRKYVDKGVVRLLWRDMPVHGKRSEAAAVAGRAAARQGKFWPFNRAVFALTGEKLSPGALRGAAKRAGLDLGRYGKDIKDPALRTAVEQDQAFGEAIGAPGAPAFLINGKALYGDQPLSRFEKAITKARKG